MFEAVTSNKCGHAIFAREISHRAANALQQAMAAVRMSRKGDKLVLDEAVERLDGAAALHKLLGSYRSCLVELGDMIERTCEATLKAAGCGGDVLPHYDFDDVLVDAAVIRPLLMAVAELIENCARHAFPEGYGSILVALRNDGPSMRLIIEDTGTCGGWRRPGGQGKGIVDDLAALLGGRVERIVTPGGSARVEIWMPTLSAAAAEPAGEA